MTEALEARSRSGTLLKKSQNITAKSVLSPFFAANDFAFAYAKA